MVKLFQGNTANKIVSMGRDFNMEEGQQRFGEDTKMEFVKSEYIF